MKTKFVGRVRFLSEDEGGRRAAPPESGSYFATARSKDSPGAMDFSIHLLIDAQTPQGGWRAVEASPLTDNEDARTAMKAGARLLVLEGDRVVADLLLEASAPDDAYG